MCVSDLQFNKSYEGTEAYAQTKVRAVAACWYSNQAMVSDNLPPGRSFVARASVSQRALC